MGEGMQRRARVSEKALRLVWLGFFQLVIAVGLGGCSSVGYYSQAVSGHLELMSRTRPVSEVIDDPATRDEVREKLRLVPAALAFAEQELGLPVGGSYREYSDLGRSAVTWVLFRTDPFSVELKPTCFLVVGCLSYQGWFSRADAEAAARAAEARGEDVYLAASPAYSSLGWFDDPVVNTMLQWREADLVGLLFHELAHQKVYLRHDTEFNESLANFVEREGLKRFYAQRGEQDEWRRHEASQALRDEFRSMVMRYREALAAGYRAAQSDYEKALIKGGSITAMREEFGRRRDADDHWAVYAHWFAKPINNAQLASLSTYNRLIPDFDRLLQASGGSFERFWERLRPLEQMSRQERRSYLASINGAPPR